VPPTEDSPTADIFAKVLFSRKAKTETEMNIDKDDTIKVLKQFGEWWYGTSTSSGKTGYFPANFVNIIKPHTPDMPPLAQTTQPFNSNDSPVYNPNASNDSSVYNPNSSSSPYSIDSNSSSSMDINPPPPPPEDNNSYGGSAANNLYKGGDIVHYRGDTKPERLWSVKNIGNQFITIETDDNEHLDIIDLTKVVSPFDIYNQGDHTFNKSYIEPVSAPAAIEQLQSKIPMNTQPPTINFAPVIAINTDAKENSNTIEEIPNNNSMLMSGIKVKNPTEAPAPTIPDKDLFSGGLVIKKSG